MNEKGGKRVACSETKWSLKRANKNKNTGSKHSRIVTRRDTADSCIGERLTMILPADLDGFDMKFSRCKRLFDNP